MLAFWLCAQQGHDTCCRSIPGNPDAAWQHIKSSIAAIEARSDNAEHVQASGVDVLTGEASFVDAHTLQVGAETISSKYFLLATGSDPSVPPIPGLDTVPYLTNETFFSGPSLPKRLAIIGGGPIGCELAGAAAKLGSTVTLLQAGDRLLPRETPKVSDVIKRSLEEAGVTVILNATTKQVVKTGESAVTITYESGSARELEADALLVAAGRTPRTKGLGLEKAGVKVGEMGVVTDHYLRTSAKHIYAAGDVTTSPKFTHLAAQQAGLALRNMLSGIFKKSTTSLSEIPAITFTQPEVARFGVDSSAAEKAKEMQVLSLDYHDIDRAITDGQTGFIEVVVDGDGDIELEKTLSLYCAFRFWTGCTIRGVRKSFVPC